MEEDEEPGKKRPPRCHIYLRADAKGLAGNKVSIYAPSFGSDLDDPREQNPRNSRRYFEGFVSEERSKMARRWDAEMSNLLLDEPLGLGSLIINVVPLPSTLSAPMDPPQP